jgi:CheY-like chemotaxis protein
MSMHALALARRNSHALSLEPAAPDFPDLRDLVSRLSSEVAGRLTRALEHLGDLADCSRPDGKLLQSVGDEIAGARRVGIVGQQIVRLASGQVQPESEPVMFCEMLRGMIVQRRAADPAAIEFRSELPRTRIDCDASLVGALLQSMLDWCTEHTSAPVALSLTDRDPKHGLALSAELTLPEGVSPESLESLNWHLMYFTAQALGVRLARQQAGQVVTLVMQLPKARVVDLPLSTSVPVVPDVPVAGCQVLVVAPERDMRNQVRLAIRGLDLLVDYVGSVDAAVRYCEDALPEAVVYDGHLDGARVTELRNSLQAEEPGLPFIEISQQDHGPRLAQPGVSMVRFDALMGHLPSTLATELARAR